MCAVAHTPSSSPASRGRCPTDHRTYAAAGRRAPSSSVPRALDRRTLPHAAFSGSRKPDHPWDLQPIRLHPCSPFVRPRSLARTNLLGVDCNLYRFRPLPVRDDFGLGFFNLVIKSPPPHNLGVVGSDLHRCFLPELHRRLEHRHHHPNLRPHRCYAPSMSPDSLVHAQRVTPTPLVLEVKTSPRLGPRLAGGSHAAALAMGAVTAHSARHTRHPGLGWPSHIGRWLGHPPSRPPHPFGP
jgi:hypothetical protein